MVSPSVSMSICREHTDSQVRNEVFRTPLSVVSESNVTSCMAIIDRDTGGQKLNLLPFQERGSANAAAMAANRVLFISREFFCH